MSLKQRVSSGSAVVYHLLLLPLTYPSKQSGRNERKHHRHVVRLPRRGNIPSHLASAFRALRIPNLVYCALLSAF
jgi:hypothetical protein